MAKGLNKGWAAQLADQGLHFLAAFVVTALVMAVLRPVAESEAALAGVVLGLALGLTREITEGGDVTSDGSIVDVCFWILGGVVGGVWMGV